MPHFTSDLKRSSLALQLLLGALCLLVSFHVRAQAPRSLHEKREIILNVLQANRVNPALWNLSELEHSTEEATLKKRLIFLDPKNQFDRFFTIELNPQDPTEKELHFFLDRDEKAYPFHTFSLSPSLADSAYVSRAKEASLKSTSSLPLQGVKIALDPGHMGSDTWDELAEKYVKTPQGERVNEGRISLQTALLLEEELKALGAEVLLTRRTLGPVTDVKYEDIDLDEFSKTKIEPLQYEDWFTDLVNAYEPGPYLFRVFKGRPELQKLKSESMRYWYFFYELDLNARVELIQKFQPDLTIMIHFDMMKPGHLSPVRHHATKAYVPGNFYPKEFATLENRLDFTRHLLANRMWEDSVNLTRNLLHEISTQLQIPLQTQHGPNGLALEPGIFARNLLLTRKLNQSPLSFLECFFYDDPTEFQALQNRTIPLKIDGRDEPASPRLKALSLAIRDGILGYFKNYQ